MFENIMKIFKKFSNKEEKVVINSKEAAKERLHLVLMQDRANVSADFLELMKQEIIEVIKKYIEVDESAIDVRLTNKENGDGTNGAPALYANIPIVNIKTEAKKIESKEEKEQSSEGREKQPFTKEQEREFEIDQEKREHNEGVEENKTINEEARKQIVQENREDKKEENNHEDSNK